MKSPDVVDCRNGIFTLPEQVIAMLKSGSASGMVYVRQDEETPTISPSRIPGGRRRQIRPQLRAGIFRDATRVMAIPMSDTVRFIAVEFRRWRRPREAPLD